MMRNQGNNRNINDDIDAVDVKNTETNVHTEDSRPQENASPTKASTSKSSYPTKKNIPEFLSKLYQMLNFEDSEIIHWDSGKIYVRDPQRLGKEVLKKYFRHSRYTSFQRQLNYFGFRKIQGKGKYSPCVYANDDFRGSDMRAILSIKRKTHNQHDYDLLMLAALDPNLWTDKQQFSLNRRIRSEPNLWTAKQEVYNSPKQYTSSTLVKKKGKTKEKCFEPELDNHSEFHYIPLQNDTSHPTPECFGNLFDRQISNEQNSDILEDMCTSETNGEPSIDFEDLLLEIPDLEDAFDSEPSTIESTFSPVSSKHADQAQEDADIDFLDDLASLDDLPNLTKSSSLVFYDPVAQEHHQQKDVSADFNDDINWDGVFLHSLF